MTETKEVGVVRRKNATGPKMLVEEIVYPSPLIRGICEICGLNFGIWV